MQSQKPIRKAGLPMVRRKEFGMEQPPNAPALATVGDLATLFERAFDKDGASRGRPTALHWITGLMSLEKSVTQCKSNSSHWFLKTISCPWCPMEAATAVQLFSTGTSRPDELPSDIGAVSGGDQCRSASRACSEIRGTWPVASPGARGVGQ